MVPVQHTSLWRPGDVKVHVVEQLHERIVIGLVTDIEDVNPENQASHQTFCYQWTPLRDHNRRSTIVIYRPQGSYTDTWPPRTDRVAEVTSASDISQQTLE